MQKQKGYVGLVVIIFLLAFAIIIYPLKFPSLEESVVEEITTYCRDFVKDPNPPVVEAPAYDDSGIIANSKRTYRLIKENVLMSSFYYNATQWEHFYQDYEEQYEAPGGKKYIKRIPNGVQGKSYPVSAETSRQNYLAFAEYGLLYLFHTDDNYKLTTYPGNPDLITVDIYKAEDLPGLPEWVTKCIDTYVGGEYATEIIDFNKRVTVPDQFKSQNQDQLQLEWFLFNNHRYIKQAWWTPHCKPAVYLYPTKKQLVNVKVHPRGELGYTDPVYDHVRGWTVQAFPDGKLLTINDERITNNYLYYEAKIKDEVIKKPSKGWVVKNDEMGQLFNEVLPKLGLNEKEKKDFMDYWLKQLPESKYYFVGLMDKNQRDYLEVLEVTPAPDTSIRFSLFFEPLDQSISVTEPEINTPVRNGFTLVDWGGMIKLHKDTPFTCSQ